MRYALGAVGKIVGTRGDDRLWTVEFKSKPRADAPFQVFMRSELKKISS